jgi:hypothetical protein
MSSEQKKELSLDERLLDACKRNAVDEAKALVNSGARALYP